MKKVILGISFLLTAAVIFAFGGKEADAKSPLAGTTLNLYTWAGMFPREVLSGFEKETGCRINYANFDTDEAMLAKLQETGGAGYDFVIADDYILEMVYKQGLAQDFDKEQIPNYENINPVFQGQFFDPDNVFTIPHGAGIPLIAYDPSLTEISIEGYADLWNPALNQNVAVIGNYRVVNGMALKILGESYNTEDPFSSRLYVVSPILTSSFPRLKVTLFLVFTMYKAAGFAGSSSAFIFHLSQLNIFPFLFTFNSFCPSGCILMTVRIRLAVLGWNFAVMCHWFTYLFSCPFFIFLGSGGQTN